MKLRLLAGALVVAAALLVGTVASDLSPAPTQAERVALYVDAALDRLEEPEFEVIDLELAWPLEIAPYFEYEGLIFGTAPIPAVVFEPQLEGDSHNHLSGYTYCEDEVFINLRYLNWTSSWNNDIAALATLVHEMIHTLGGDFCTWDTVTTESRTQLGTLEVLAAMANHGNETALYALLDELRGIAMSTALYEALEADDLDGYREFRARIFEGDALLEARFEKSMRFWSTDMATLKGILDRYNRIVFNDVFDDFEFEAVLPGGGARVDVVLMDDLRYVLTHLDELTQDDGGE